MFKIGVSGYMGSGKTIATNYLLKKLDAVLIDADREAKILMASSNIIKDELSEKFNVIKNGKIEFSKLGSIVFNSNSSLIKLNRIVHPLLIEFLKSKIDSSSKTVILDAALIPLWNMERFFDSSIWIDAPEAIRIDRVIERNVLSKPDATSRVESQMSLFSPSQSSTVINNSSSKEFLFSQLDKIGYEIK
jgi:dephospho-CoA kinase